jgi:hypothetical protein
MALNRRNPIWPYLLVLACLFALSVAAPRGWQRTSQEDPAVGLLRKCPTDATPPTTAEVVRPTTIIENRAGADGTFESAALETRPQPEASAERIAESWRFPAAAELTAKPDPSSTLSGPLWPRDENRLSSTPSGLRADDVSTPTAASGSTLPADDSPDQPAEPISRDESKSLESKSPTQVTPGPKLEAGGPATVESNSGSSHVGAPSPLLSASQTAPAAEAPAKTPETTSSATKVEEPAPTIEEPMPPAPLMDPAWPRPVDLFAHLDRLSRYGACQQWGTDVKTEFDQLAQLGPQDCDAAQSIFSRLRKLVSEAESLVPRLPEVSAVAELRRTQYAIVRRIDLWEQICTIRRRTASTSIAEGTERLLSLIERYETDGRTSDAHHLADIRREVFASHEPDEQELARRLGVHYRNANLRVAVTAALMDRMLPAQQPSSESVNETILGNPVRGNSTISTKLSVRLIPDERTWRFDLVAQGTIDSRTRTTHGSVTFFNAGQATYQVRKRVVVNGEAVTIDPAVGDANNWTELQGLRTSVDSVPFLGSLVRNYAASQERDQEDEADRQAEDKVVAKSIARLDANVNPRLAKAQETFRHDWLEPMRKLALDPTALAMQTTDARLLFRGRLAGLDQLGAHTPRPEAPGDSLVSTQVHESTLNNLLDHLDLAGRTFTLAELQGWLAGKLGRELADRPEDLPEGVHVTFARQDPIRVRCDANHLELIISIAEIRDSRHWWHDFEVRAAYRPVLHGLTAQFERDGTIELGGQYKGKPEVALRGIFSKVLSHERKLNLLPDTVAKDSRLAGLEVTQLVVEDGWIATAIGPVRTAVRASTAAK